MSRLWVTVGTVLGVAGVGGAALFLSRRASAASLPAPAPGARPAPPTSRRSSWRRCRRPATCQGRPDRPTGARRRPTCGRCSCTWRRSRGSRARPACSPTIAYRESRFVTTAHNGNASGEQDERDSSRAAYKNNKDRNPPLKYGEQAAEFGSGGLFGLLAPYFLWTGVPEVGKKAPLLRAPPELVFQPRAAAFGACVYMQRLLAHYRVDDVPDIKAGWASPSLLKDELRRRQVPDVRANYLENVDALGSTSRTRRPSRPSSSAAAWPGVPAVFAPRRLAAARSSS
jgi:hypothetical protein